MEPLSVWPPEDADDCKRDSVERNRAIDLLPESVANNAYNPRHQHDQGKHSRNSSSNDTDNLLEAAVKRLRGDHDHEEAYANVALARWWKSIGRHLGIKEHCTCPHSQNPNTFLRHLARHSEAQEFLQSEVSRLTDLICTHGATAKTHAVLATFLEKLGRLEEALRHIQKAVHLNPEDKEMRWLQHRTKCQVAVKRKQRELLLGMEMEHITNGVSALPKSEEVDHRSAADLTIEEFQRMYAQPGVPVVITGLSSITSVPWTIQHIRDIAGKTQVQLRKLVEGSPNWAQLETAESVTVAEFIDGLHDQDTRVVEDQRYLFDWSLPLHCPDLYREITIPIYFEGNMLLKTSPGTLYHDSWPSLFIAPKGIRSELHVDAFGSNFWMFLFHGQKRWVFFHPEDLPLLYPLYDSDQSTDPVFEVNLREPDLIKHPLLSMTRPRECILNPGELLFVPAGSPHYVENLEQSLAISSNFVDESNLELVRKELEVNSLLDERSQDLLNQLNSSK